MSNSLIDNISHVCFGTHQLQGMIQFYSTCFNAEIIHSFTNEEGFMYGAFLKLSKGVFIEFFHDENLKTGEGPYRHFCFQTSNLKLLREKFSQLGIELKVYRSKSDQTLQGWIEDPDGNKIEFHQYDEQSVCFPHV